MSRLKLLLVVLLFTLSILGKQFTFAQDEEQKVVISPQLIWHNKLGLQPQWIAVNGNMVTTASAFSSMIANFDLKSGRLIWNYEGPTPTVAEPVLVDENLFFVHKNNSISVLNQNTGEIKSKWLVFPYDDVLSQEAKEQEIKSKITQEYDREKSRERAELIKKLRRVKKLMLKDKLSHQKQLAYTKPLVCSKYVFFLASNGMMTRISKDLQEVVRYYFPIKSIKQKFFYSTPCGVNLSDNDDEDILVNLYAITADGILYDLLDDLPSFYQTEKIGTEYDDFRLPLYLINKKLYIISSNGSIYCYKIYDGLEKIWSKNTAVPKLYQEDQYGRLMVEPCFNENNDTLYINSNNKIYSINAINGKVNWVKKVSASTPTAYWKDHIIVATKDKELLFLNAKDGSIVKSTELPTSPRTKLIVEKDHLLMGDQNSLYCWKLCSEQ
ncbi:PQQ-binding-like beta-propeller repeat protein [bacterium]|nr:PQQ-binding-like beta-propeller repeat protein [bacterium]